MSERGGRGKTTIAQSSSHEFRPDALHERFLSRPDITLHARRDAEGNSAFNALDKAEIHFRVKLDLQPEKHTYVAWGEKDPNPESDLYPKGDEGILYEGLEGIEFFIKLDNVFKNRVEEIAKKVRVSNPAFREWYQGMLERQRNINKLIMYSEETNRES